MSVTNNTIQCLLLLMKSIVSVTRLLLIAQYNVMLLLIEHNACEVV